MIFGSDSNTSNILEYLKNNDEIFIQLIDKFTNNFQKIPNGIKYDFKKNNYCILYSDVGNFYIKSNSDINKNIHEILGFMKQKVFEIMSLYGETKLVDELNNKLTLYPRNKIDYYLMRLEKKDFIFFEPDNDKFKCRKADINDFNILKKLQYKYHLEEVYNDGSIYPYEAEMANFKKSLTNRINYIVLNKSGKPVSKASINSESQNSFQIGGVFTLKKFRGLGLSKFCVSNLINESLNIKKYILLYVKKENLPAISVYKNLGFKIINETSIYYY